MVIMYNQMVVDQLDQNRVFHALADPTRRDILERVLRGEHSVTTLAEPYDMSFAAVQKHVAVLEQAGLVAKRRRGREALVGGVVDSVRLARATLDELEQVWRGRIERMEEILAEDPDEGSEGQ